MEVDSLLTKFKEFSSIGNVFCLSSLLGYYEEKHEILLSLIDLYDYLLNKDLELIKKNKTPYSGAIEKSALYTVLYRQDVPDNIRLFKDKSNNHIEFTHRNIMEYQAAKVLASLSIENILQVVSVKGILLPYVRNTVGMMLNILNASGRIEDANKFNGIYAILKSHPLNYDVLLRLESDRLYNDFSDSILIGAIDYYIKHEYYDCPDSLFGFINQNPRRNFEILLGYLKDNKRIDNEQEYRILYIIYSAILHNRNDCPGFIKDYFTNVFLDKIEKDSNNIRSVAWILRVLNEQLRVFSEKEINKIIDFAIARENDPDFFISIFTILKNSVKNISILYFEKLICTFFHVMQINGNTQAEYIPSQFMNGYRMKSIRWFSIIPVGELSELYFKIKLDGFELFIREYIKFLKSYQSMIFQGEVINKLLFSGLKTFLVSYKGDLEKIIELLTDFIIIESSTDHDEENPLFASYLFIEDWGMEVAGRILDYIYLNQKNYNISEIFRVRKYFANMLFNNSLFYLIMKEIAGDNIVPILNFCLEYGVVSTINKDVFDLLPESIRSEIENRNKRSQEQIDEEEKHKRMIKEAIHIAFNDEKLKKEAKSIYDLIDKRKCEAFELEYIEDYNSYSFMNQFLIDTIESCKKECENYECFISYWFDNHQSKIVFYLMEYMKRHNLSYDILTEEEILFICDFVKNKIVIMPLNNLKPGHKWLAKLMKKTELVKYLKPIIIDSYGDDIVELIKVLNSMESISFFEKYISRNVIINYIIQNFAEMLEMDDVRILIFDYLCSINITGVQQLNLINRTKSILVDFIRKHLSDSTIFNGYSILDKLNISLKDIGLDLIIANIFFEKNGIVVSYNNAYGILDYLYYKKE